MTNPSEHQQINPSFTSNELEGQSFANADIRGRSFSGVDLSLAQFPNAQAGLTPALKLVLLFAIAGLSVLAGFVSAYASSFLGLQLAEGSIGVGLFFLAALIGFWLITVRDGTGGTLGFISIIAAIGIVAFVAIVQSEQLAASTAISSLVLGGGVASIVGLSVAIGVLEKPNLCTGLAVLGMALGTAISRLETGRAVLVIWALAPVTLLLSRYIAAQMTREVDARYRLIHQIVIRLSTILGTSFKAANLTEANFAGARLGRSDFRQAQLLRTNWRNAQLEQANFEGTYLERPVLRRLLTTGSGKGENFDRLDLRGLNLENADLSDASFIGADLSNSNLCNANLSRAKLAQAQLYGADLSGATLTGAFIQNWGIAPGTKFDGVKCDYIHMRLPTNSDPDPCRKPDNRSESFRPGDFEDFIAPILRTLSSYQEQNLHAPASEVAPKTLDLYHYEGIDPSAAALALKQLIDQNPEAQLEIRSIEGRGTQKVRLQAQVSDDVDRSQLNADYFDNYNQFKDISYPDLKKLLAGIEEKDARIKGLEEIIKSAVSSDRFYAEPPPAQTNKKTILILAANPRGTEPLRLDEEVKAIRTGLERARNRDQFVLEQRWAVTIRDVTRALLDCKPQIIHFSGHGLGNEGVDAPHDSRKISREPENNNRQEGLILEDEQGQPKLVPSAVLADLFRILAKEVSFECLVLNACYSEEQANAVSKHVPHVIGMQTAIGDRAAIQFSVGFYDAILAGQSIETAYQLGRNAIQAQGIPEQLTPVLKTTHIP